MATAAPVPATNAEVFEQYFAHVKYLIRKYGFHEELVEDMASIMMLKFVEKDVLSDYDPTKVHGNNKTANFKTFLSGFVVSYLYHYMSREIRRRDIESFSLNYSYELEDGDTDLWIDQIPEGRVDDEYDYQTLDLIIDIRNYLQENPKVMGQKQAPVKLEEFFAAVMAQVEKYGECNSKELQEQFGVSKTTISNWMKILREHVNAVIC
jgi:hypothetical protein